MGPSPLRQSLSISGRPFEEWAACGLVAVIAFCVCLQVFSRYVLNIGLVWTEDAAMFAMTWAVYFGAAMAVHEKFHVRMMATVMVLPYRAAWFVTFLSDLIWAAFLVFMMFYGWEYLELLWRQQTVIASMNIDAKWIQTIIVIGNGLMLYRLFEAYWFWWRGDRKGFPTVDNEEAPDL
jgi:TRAP-type C4-dicarboxylate transport system permease small subunit